VSWIEVSPVSVSDELLELVGGNKLVAEVLARRGYSNLDEVKAFLDPEYYQPTSSKELPNMGQAVEILELAIQEEKLICVWGDFDVDGQTSTTLLVSALEELGAKVIFHIPVRASESHGVNIANLDRMIQAGAQLLLTCDTGISDHDAVAHAREKGLQVVITDHHNLPSSLPDADAIINPKMLPPEHSLATLPGVGVAFKLIEEIYLRVGRENELEKFLDLVALGIVADVAYLQGDVRYLLQRGLEVLRQTQRLGLQSLFSAVDLQPEYISEVQIGFVIGPRLNALGRLADANIIVEYLTTEDQSRARIITNQLEGLNAQRKLLTKQVFEGALSKIDQDPSLLKYSAIVLAHENWPAGVIGIVASRLVDRYHKPVVMLSAPPDGKARGSARSIAGCDISQAIAGCKDLLEGFGGHPMAAGLSMDSDRIDKFRELLSKEVSRQVGEEQLEPDLLIDDWLPLENLSLDLIDQIGQLSPFGPGNPVLQYATGSLRLVSHSPLGRSEEHLQLIVQDEAENQQKLFWWNGAGWELPKGIFDIVYTVNISTFRGERELQVEFVDFRIVDNSNLEEDILALTIIDHRQENDPKQILRKIREKDKDVIVWAEGEEKIKVEGKTRKELFKADILVLWNVPPSFSILKQAIGIIRPKKIHVFGINSDMDDVKSFVKRLSGLCKYSIGNNDGRVSIDELAASTNQTNAAVRLGLAWLESKGNFAIKQAENDLLLIEQDDTIESVVLLEDFLSDLTFLLRESSSFRNNFIASKNDRLAEILTPGP
jgi:single-stranded-DNA-specific exonuclease